MRYSNIVPGRFVDRPNRFIAHVELDGQVQTVHVKNTGRCRELLVPGATVYVQHSDDPNRKTQWDLIAVEKGERLINMDAQAPNKVFGEWAQAGSFLTNLTLLKPETTYASSRFDFYAEGDGKRHFIEVKGVTLEQDGIVRFPDAPTERGVKHLEELVQAKREGYECWACFVIQMSDVKWFEPNDATHPQFGDALRRAEQAGVRILALDCEVTAETLAIKGKIPVRL